MAKKIPETIEEVELAQILKAAKPQHKLPFLLGFYQCLRISEIVGLGKAISRCCKADIIKKKEMQEIDGETRKILQRYCSKCNSKVNTSDIRRHPTEMQIKPLTSENIEKDWLKLKDAKGGKDRTIPINPKVRKYLKKLPVKIGSRALETAFKKYAKEVLGKDMHFHNLRHSGAVHYLNVEKWNIRLVQQFLGHSNLNTTQIYTVVRPDDLMKAMMGE